MYKFWHFLSYQKKEENPWETDRQTNKQEGEKKRFFLGEKTFTSIFFFLTRILRESSCLARWGDEDEEEEEEMLPFSPHLEHLSGNPASLSLITVTLQVDLLAEGSVPAQGVVAAGGGGGGVGGAVVGHHDGGADAGDVVGLLVGQAVVLGRHVHQQVGVLGQAAGVRRRRRRRRVGVVAAAAAAAPSCCCCCCWLLLLLLLLLLVQQCVVARR